LKIKDYLSSSVLFLFAVVLFFQSRGLPFWDESGPSAGFFPTILCILLGLLSLTIFIHTSLQTRQAKEIFTIFGPKKIKLLIYFGSFFTFAFIFTKVGYSVSLMAFLVLILRIIEKRSWKITLTVTATSIMASYFIFRFLQVPIPEGLLSFVIDLLR
jgi:hypothetical protein